MQKNIFVLGAALALLNATAVQAEEKRPQVGPYVQAYSGDFNSSVYLVRLGDRDKAEALVLVSGIDHEMDGKVVKTKIVVRDENLRSFMLEEKGESRELLRLEGSSARLLISTAPLGPSSYSLAYDWKLSERADAEHILTRWLQKP